MKGSEFIINKTFILSLLIAAFGFSAFYAGVKLGEGKAEPTAVKEEVRTIAVVNLDQGIRVQDKMTNYGAQLISFMDDHFYSTGLEEARTGVENGRFAAYVIIPSSFSGKVFSINTSPEKAVLEYAVNPNLREDLVPHVIYDLKGFEMKMNTDVSYLYLHSILQEFHTGQDSAVTIMVNDKKDMENLSVIVPEELMQPLAFVELQPLREYPEEIDLGQDYELLAGAVEEMGNQYDTYAAMTEDDLQRIYDDRFPVLDAADSLNSTVSALSLLEDQNGEPVYEEGKDSLVDGLGLYQASLKQEREDTKLAFEWMARRDSLASPSDAGEAQNTWLDEIQQEEKRQRDEYDQELQEWRDSFDYSMLATSSDAEPPDATPPDATAPDASRSVATRSKASGSNAGERSATPSDAIEEEGEGEVEEEDVSGRSRNAGRSSPSDAYPEDSWLVERDMNMVMSSMDIIYELIEDDLEELYDEGILDDDSLSEVEWVIWQSVRDEDAVRDAVASASNANPVTVNPEADAYVRKFLNSMPRKESSLKDKLDEVGEQIKEFCRDQIDRIESGEEVPVQWFVETFEELVVGRLYTQEGYLQGLITDELDKFQLAFEDYAGELDDYQADHRIGGGQALECRSVLEQGIYTVEQTVNDKSDKDRELIRAMEKDKEKDVEALQNNLDQAYEGTTNKLTEVFDKAKRDRRELNQGNEELLSAFTQKLPYTRNGSVPATNTYDFIVNPVETREKELKARKSLISRQGVQAGNVIVILLLGAAVVILAVQNKRLKRENGFKTYQTKR